MFNIPLVLHSHQQTADGRSECVLNSKNRTIAPRQQNSPGAAFRFVGVPVGGENPMIHGKVHSLAPNDMQ